MPSSLISSWKVESKALYLALQLDEVVQSPKLLEHVVHHLPQLLDVQHLQQITALTQHSSYLVQMKIAFTCSWFSSISLFNSPK